MVMAYSRINGLEKALLYFIFICKTVVYSEKGMEIFPLQVRATLRFRRTDNFSKSINVE